MPFSTNSPPQSCLRGLFVKLKFKGRTFPSSLLVHLNLCELEYNAFSVAQSRIKQSLQHVGSNETITEPSIVMNTNWSYTNRVTEKTQSVFLLVSNQYKASFKYSSRINGEVHCTKATISASGWIFMKSRTPKIEGALSVADSFDLQCILSGFLKALASCTISKWSVDTQMEENRPTLISLDKDMFNRVRSLIFDKFFKGMLFEPPLAKIRAAVWLCVGFLINIYRKIYYKMLLL